MDDHMWSGAQQSLRSVTNIMWSLSAFFAIALADFRSKPVLSGVTISSDERRHGWIHGERCVSVDGRWAVLQTRHAHKCNVMFDWLKSKMIHRDHTWPYLQKRVDPKIWM